MALLTPSATTASSWEAHIVNIVGAGKEHHLQIVLHHGTHTSARVAALGTYAEIDVGHNALVHTWFDAEVEHRLFLTVLDSADTGKVTLLVISLDTVDDVGGQVLQGCLRITRHELLTIDENLLNFLSVDLDGSVVADLCTWEALHEFLDH